MRSFLSWLKSNPITVVSAIVGVASIAVIVVFVLKDADVRKDLEARKRTHGQVSGLLQSSVTVANPNPETYSVTVNTAVVEQAKQLNATYAQEIDALLTQVPLANQEGHEVILEGVLPKWSQASEVFDFVEDYREKLQEMLGSKSSDDGLPRLQGGAPRPLGEIELEAKIFSDSYFGENDSRGLSNRGRSAAEQAAMQDELDQEVKKYVRQLLADEAMKIKIYAQPDPQLPGFSLDMASWAYATELPEPWELFEGQLDFWIQQDLIQALALANAESDTVLTSPVKRLIGVRIDDGYAGFHTKGLVPTEPIVPLTDAVTRGGSSRSMLASVSERGLNFAESASGRSLVGSVPGRAEVAYQVPPSGFKGEVTETLGDNYHVGISGRISNPLYLVRHARLELILDSQTGVAKLTEAINSVNQMAIVSMRFRDEDEYEAMQQGYIYGEADVIHVEVIVETIWFTSWMNQYMPDRVKHFLGLEQHEQFDDEGMDALQEMMGFF